MIKYKQKEYTVSSENVNKATQLLEKDKIYDYELSDKVSKDSITVTGDLNNLEIWIPRELEYVQYSIEDCVRDILPYAYLNTKSETSNLFKMEIRGRFTILQYVKLLKHIIKETEFVVLKIE